MKLNLQVPGIRHLFLSSASGWISLLLLALIGLNYYWQLLLPIDRVGSDALLALHSKPRHPPSNIVLIDIDQSSLDHPQMLELAGNWPWPRLVHGEMVSYLAQQGASAILFDVTFTEPDVFRPASDAVFADSLRSTQIPVYLPLVIAPDGAASLLADLPPAMAVEPSAHAQKLAQLPLIAPKALPVDVWRTGYINFTSDEDQMGRRSELYRLHAGWKIPHIIGRVAKDKALPLPEQSDITLNWYGKPFQHVSYHELYLSSLSSSDRSPVELAGKIVIIGSTAPGMGDFHTTPIGTRTPGPEILATAIANLEAKDWLQVAHPGWSALFAVVLVLGSMFGYSRGLHPSLSIGAGLVVSAAAVIAAYKLLDFNLQWSPFAALTIGWTGQLSHGVASYLQERRRRQQTTQLFSRFLDPHVVRQLTDLNASAEAKVGRSQEITLLFSDIRGFTTLSERNRPEEIVSLLNRYFDQQVEAIFDSGGTLDKFIGDALMAFWGAPVELPDHAVRAVSAALRMSEQIEEFKKTLDFPFEIGIGVHTGEAVVGFIGSRQRLDYTAIGDAVNLASRIEGKTAGVARVLVSEATRNACGEAFNFIDHGVVQVKGRTEPVRVFEPLWRIE